MTHRTTIEQLVAPAPPGDVDDWGNPTPAPSAWAVKAANVACWYWAEAERETVGPQATAVVEDARAIVPKATNVRERDRLNGITTKAGAVVRAGILEIESVISHRDHLELMLRGIQ